MSKSIIKNFIAKMVAGRSDDGIMITLSDPRKVDFQAAMLEDLLMRNGIDPRAITSEEQLKMLLNQIKAAEAQAIRNTDVSGIRNAESAQVFDMQGKEIPKGSQIMGGEAVETEAEIAARLEKDNKDSIQKILNRKNREDVYGIEDYDTTNMSEIKKEIIRTETKLGNLNPNLPGFRERAKPLIDKIEALKNKMRDDKADGGRIGFKGGADMGTVSTPTRAATARSVNVSPSGSVTTSRTRGPDPVDDRGSSDQNMVQMLVNAGYTPKEIRRITEGPNVIDRIKESRLNNPITRGILRTGAYLYNPTIAGIDFRRAVQLKNLYDVTKDSITNPEITEEDMQYATGGRVGFKGGLSKLLKEFMERRKFLKTMVGNTEKNKRARELEMLKETIEKARENPGFEFPSGKELRTEIEKKIGPILLKDRKLNADGGRIGLKSGTGITDRLVSLLGGKNMAAAELGLEGLNQIYQLLQMPGLYAKGGRAGFFMGSKLPKGLATLRQMLNYMGNKSDKVQYPSDVLKMVNPKSLNTMLDDPRLQGKVNIKEGIMASDMVKNFQSKMGEDRVQLVRDMLDAAKNLKRTDDKILAYKNEIKERMMKELNMSEAEADRAATAMSQLAMDITKMPNTPKLTDEGILELENVLKNMETGGKKKRDLNADGGRIGLKKGSGMTRRTFLKIFAGLAAIPIVGKIIKPLKTVKGYKKLPIIKTDDVPGKPEWFDQLVNKVIIEGEDVTKKFATKDREIVHMKVLEEGTGGKKFPPGTPGSDDTSIIVTQDLDAGAVRVEYRNPENMYGDPVELRYKKPNPDEGDPRPGAEFDTSESIPVARADGPDDYNIDIDEGGGQSIKDLTSDVSKLKQYATGQKPTLKEIVQIKKRKDKARAISQGEGEAESDFIINRQGEEIVEYPEPDFDDAFASGGIARMLGE
jgi:hypothetical protein